MKKLLAMKIFSKVNTLLCSAMLVSCGEVEPANYCEDSLTNSLTSYRYAQGFVKEGLRSPASAVFPSSQDSLVDLTYIGNCTHRVKGFVDAQNAFGGTERNEYLAEIQYDMQSGNVTLLSLDM